MIPCPLLRDVLPADVAMFFEQQLDPVANEMASLRVLDKCGFSVIGEDHFPNARGEEIEELVLELRWARRRASRLRGSG